MSNEIYRSWQSTAESGCFTWYKNHCKKLYFNHKNNPSREMQFGVFANEKL